MDSAFGWLGQLVEWFSKFIPHFVLLDSTEEAVKFEGFFLPARWRKFKGDMRLTRLQAGLHWYLPAASAVQNYPVSYQTDNLPSQVFETADGVQIVVGGMLTYRVDDIMKLVPHTHSALKMIQVLTLAAIHDVCCNMAWSVLKTEQQRGTLDTKLKHASQKALLSFGVKVEKCMLTDLARTRVFRLINSTQQDDQ